MLTSLFDCMNLVMGRDGGDGVGGGVGGGVGWDKGEGVLFFVVH